MAMSADEQRKPSRAESSGSWYSSIGLLGILAATILTGVQRHREVKNEGTDDAHSSPALTSIQASPNVGDLYDRALTLIQYHVELLWLIFGAFLLTETVLLAGVASMIKDHPEPLLFWGAMLGLALTLPWASSWSQNYSYYRLRMLQAKRYEPEAGTFLTEGARLADGEQVGELRMRWLARKLPPRRAVPFLIVAFAVAFGSLAIVHLPHWRGVESNGQRSPAPTSNIALEPSARN